MQQRLKIGVDIDGVLIDLNPRAYLEFCKRVLGWNVDFTAYEETHAWPQALGVTSQDAISKSFEQYINEGEESQQPIEGAHDALKQLGEFAQIYLITARSRIMRRVTEQFLAQHLPDVRYAELSMDNHESKGRAVAALGVNFYIDDSYREISLLLQDATVDTIVIPFPAFHGVPRWQTIHDPRVHWLAVWAEIQAGVDIKHHPEIRRRAWREIVDVILAHQST